MGGRLLVHLRLLTSGIQLKKSPMPAILPILPYGAISCCIKTLMRGCGSVRLGTDIIFFHYINKKKNSTTPHPPPPCPREGWQSPSLLRPILAGSSPLITHCTPSTAPHWAQSLLFQSYFSLFSVFCTVQWTDHWLLFIAHCVHWVLGGISVNESYFLIQKYKLCPAIPKSFVFVQGAFQSHATAR